LKKKFVTGISKDKVLENLMGMDDSEDDGRDKKDVQNENDQLRRMEANEHKGTKQDKKRKRMENMGHKVNTDSDENSEQIDDDSGDDEITKAKKKIEAAKKKDEPEIIHNPLKKTDEQNKRGQFLGEKYGHYKIGTYV
jgi:hypothetical protein